MKMPTTIPVTILLRIVEVDTPIEETSRVRIGDLPDGATPSPERAPQDIGDTYLKGYDQGLADARLKTIAAFDEATDALFGPSSSAKDGCATNCNCVDRDRAYQLRETIFGLNA